MVAKKGSHRRGPGCKCVGCSNLPQEATCQSDRSKIEEPIESSSDSDSDTDNLDEEVDDVMNEVFGDSDGLCNDPSDEDDSMDT